MGILMVIGVVASILTAGGTSYLVYKERERSLEKVDRIIKEIDEKPEDPQKPEDAVKEILDKVNGDNVKVRWILKEEPVKGEPCEDIPDKAEAEEEKTEEKDQPEDIPDPTVAELHELGEKILQQEREDFEDLLLEMEEGMEKAGIDLKEVDYNVWSIPRLYAEFDRMFDNGLPVEQAKSTLFSKALGKGLINQDTYDRAFNYYGEKLWNYVGD